MLSITMYETPLETSGNPLNKGATTEALNFKLLLADYGRTSMIYLNDWLHLSEPIFESYHQWLQIIPWRPQLLRALIKD